MTRENKLNTSADYINYLKNPDLSPKQIFRTLESLQVSLRSNRIQFLTEFAQSGLKALLSILNECYRRYIYYSLSSFMMLGAFETINFSSKCRICYDIF